MNLYDPQKNGKGCYQDWCNHKRAEVLQERCPAAKRVVVIGDCELYQGDCLEVMPTLGPVDAVVTDPPYGIGFDYSSYDDTRENLRLLIAGIFRHREQFERLIVLCGPSQIHEYPATDWIGAITWNTTGSFGKYGYSQWTPVLLYGKDLEGFGRVNGVTKSETLHINGGGSVGFQREKLEGLHVCPKPIGVMLHTVKRYTPELSTILDSFMGSGTTGVACAKTGRKFIGIELDPDYFDIACERIARAYQQPDMFIEREKPKAEQLDIMELAE